MLRSVKRLPLVLAISAATLASSVHAQQLEEVIVTAQKRAENLQDVPISVSAIAGEKIQDATILNFAALADFVPASTLLRLRSIPTSICVVSAQATTVALSSQWACI